MAIAVADRVSITIPSALTAAEERSNNVLFGIVAEAGPPLVIQWENGVQTEIQDPTLVLDKIVPQDASNTLAGRVCQIEGYTSPQYRVIVLATYTRQLNGAGSTVDYAYVQALSSGARFEVRVSDLAGVENG